MNKIFLENLRKINIIRGCQTKFFEVEEKFNLSRIEIIKAA